MGTASQLAEKLQLSGASRQGTTLVVPTTTKKWPALAAGGSLSGFSFVDLVFPAALLSR
jgi:hypothetical protein